MKLAALVTGRHDEGVLWSTIQKLRPLVVRFDAWRLHQMREQMDALMVVGDRYETALAAVLATRNRVPIVHLHGGEVTEGASDDAFRNAITKMAHLHLVSTVRHGANVVAMGEDPSTVHLVGAPGLDNLHRDDLPDRAFLEGLLGIRLAPPVVIVTLHPATLGEDPRAAFEAVQGAMQAVKATYVVTEPNTDPGSEHIRGWAVMPQSRVVAGLGARAYWGLMKVADAMVGNSSSGLIEAPAVQLPVVNVGDRQKGRLRGANVIDAPANSAAVAVALRAVLAPSFRLALAGTGSPYGDGHAAEKIAEVLGAWTPPSPPRKKPCQV